MPASSREKCPAWTSQAENSSKPCGHSVGLMFHIFVSGLEIAIPADFGLLFELALEQRPYRPLKIKE